MSTSKQKALFKKEQELNNFLSMFKQLEPVLKYDEAFKSENSSNSMLTSSDFSSDQSSLIKRKETVIKPIEEAESPLPALKKSITEDSVSATSGSPAKTVKHETGEYIQIADSTELVHKPLNLTNQGVTSQKSSSKNSQ